MICQATGTWTLKASTAKARLLEGILDGLDADSMAGNCLSARVAQVGARELRPALVPVRPCKARRRRELHARHLFACLTLRLPLQPRL